MWITPSMESKMIRGYKAKVVAVALSLCIASTTASQICKQDSDCSKFGDLKCIKSRCDWGLCSCPPKLASTFSAKEGKFKCVPLKRVGERCSPDGLKGMCGAIKAICNPDTERCECESTYIPDMDGMYCFASNERAKGEYCNADISGGTCSCGTVPRAESGANTPPQCGCPARYRLSLSNAIDKTRFLQAVFPSCQANKIGDLCVKDDDCHFIALGASSSGGGKCVNNECVCKTAGHVASYDRRRCGQPLAFNAACTTNVGGLLLINNIGTTCQGDLGLVCGDPCVATSGTQLTCTCSADHTIDGTICKKRGVGDACFGDENCRNISSTSACVRGYCEASSTVGLQSAATIILAGILVSFSFTSLN